MKKSIFIIVLLILLPASSLYAMSGEGYLKYCSSVDANSAEFYRCGAYVIGVVDTMRASKAGNVAFKDVCFPKKTDELQMIQITLDWLKKNPQSQSSWAAFAVTMAIYENFKCGCD